MKKLIHLAVTIAVILSVVAGAGPAFAEGAKTGTVTVIHGIPGLVVDVYVNGALTLKDFQPLTVTSPPHAAGRQLQHRDCAGGWQPGQSGNFWLCVLARQAPMFQLSRI